MEDKEKKEIFEIDKISKEIKYKKREFKVKIVNENRQKAIRLPQDVVNYLNIDEKKNKFKLIMDEKERTLKGELIEDEG